LHDRIGWFDGFGWLCGLRLPDRFVLPESLVPPFGEFALRLLNIEDIGNVAPPNFGELVICAITGHVQGQSPVAGMGDVLAKLDFIRRKNLHTLATTRNRDIPLLLVRGRFDGRIREQDVIHGLALGGVGRDRVAAHELPVIFRQHPAIIQSDASVLMNSLYRHQFAIGEPTPILALGIGLELQAVAGGQEKFFRLADGDFIQFLERNWPDTAVGFNQQMFVGNAA